MLAYQRLSSAWRPGVTLDSSLLKSEIAKRDNEVNRLQLELSDARHAIETQLRDGPLATVEAWWKTLAISEANDKRDAAYRSRDHAMRVLWHLDRMHHEARPGECKCKCRTVDCPEWKLLDEHRNSLYSWERKQVQRLDDGLEHGLPADHPEVLKKGSTFRSFRRSS